MKFLEIKRLLRRSLANTLAKFNYKITKIRASEFFPSEFLETYKKIKPYSMVDEHDAFATWEAVNYLIERGIEGSFVECGVWRGGVSILIADRLIQLNSSKRTQYLYDTFEGMSEPTSKDIDKYGSSASNRLQSVGRKDGADNVWAFASIDDVKKNFERFKIPHENISMIKGKVEDTIPSNMPEKIALLRLDTDWYESTKHELIHLYPLLQKGGVLLIDDYGMWSGCREAVDEYFSGDVVKPLFMFQPSGSILAIKV